MADRTIRAEDNGRPLLDADGEPFVELEVDRVDDVDEAGDTIAELASRQREWRYGHVIVDEAQDLTPMEWRMVARRAIGGSMTIVGDLAQRTIGPPGTWETNLPGALADHSYAELTVNYRSPAEVNSVASAILAELAPELSPSTAIRSTGKQPTVEQVEDLGPSLEGIVHREEATAGDGRVAVIGVVPFGAVQPVRPTTQVLTPREAKGLEFDTVVLVEPADILADRGGLSLLYVAVTRATHRLVIVHRQPLPAVLTPRAKLGD
jgi:DNA helicase IV